MRTLILFFALIPFSAFAQEPAAPLKWFEKISIKGYAQVRYNRLLESNNDFTVPGVDRSLGDKQGLFLRRARLTFSGDISERVFVYIQPDYATEASTAASNGAASPSQNYFQIRDAYFDLNLTLDKEWRLRTGISKVPFGFSNLQSSSDRGPLDRDDALNMGAPNERDTGIFLMYTPAELKKRFKELKGPQFKGTGDYGMLSVGAYNGQTLNRREENNDLHRVARVTWPFKFREQYVETSLQAYEGKFEPNMNGGPGGKDYYDQRSAASLIVYPQPLGFQAEYVTGNAPAFDPDTAKIATTNLKGYYLQLNYHILHNDERFFPFVRFQEYDGNRKLENGSPRSRVNEWEIGTEWQPDPAFELTVAYMLGDRMTERAGTKTSEEGQMLRLQAQFNY